MSTNISQDLSICYFGFLLKVVRDRIKLDSESKFVKVTITDV